MGLQKGWGLISLGHVRVCKWNKTTFRNDETKKIIKGLKYTPLHLELLYFLYFFKLFSYLFPLCLQQYVQWLIDCGRVDTASLKTIKSLL